MGLVKKMVFGCCAKEKEIECEKRVVNKLASVQKSSELSSGVTTIYFSQVTAAVMPAMKNKRMTDLSGTRPKPLPVA